MKSVDYSRQKHDRSRHSRASNSQWASTSFGRTITRTGVLLKKHLWIWPIIAVILLTIIGYVVRNAIESTMKENLRSELETLRDVEAAMLETWHKVQVSNAEAFANNFEIRNQVYELLKREDALLSDVDVTPPVESTTDIHQLLNKSLAPALASYDYPAFFITDKSKRILASTIPSLIGREDIEEYDRFLSRVFEGETVISAPFPSIVMQKTKSGKLKMGQPTMFVCAPIRDTSFQVVGALAFQIQPDREFTRILQLGRLGESGETYVFNKDGIMASNSRFDDDLILLGLLADAEDSHSILNLQVRDPKGNMTQGFRPNVRRADLALTLMAGESIAGRPGTNVDGYRDYRGVPVVGAWMWLPKYELGLATEVDVEEAFRPLSILRIVFWAMFALLVVSALAIFVFTIIVARLGRRAQSAEIAAKQIGQYQLEGKLGSGGMGIVYKGHHAMLRRPTAIKMLDIDKVNDTTIQRFEREVKITCQLNHPNTIEIYDYGRTPKGVFYYAMEYLNGIDLQALVSDFGPQTEARVIFILQQVCGSLFEAHSQGLVHRDIKPSNIMLNNRGYVPDMVKVLDFGLVKALDSGKQLGVSVGKGLTGTPLYMSPEAIQAPELVDARSDLYAVGAVGYFLLTGRSMFDADSIVELCQKHVSELPKPPSELIGETISNELEGALLMCLEKDRSKRPQTARDLSQLLSRCPASGNWTSTDAEAWWQRYERGGLTKSLSRPLVDKAALGSQSKFDVTGAWVAPKD